MHGHMNVKIISMFTRATSETYSKPHNIQFLYISALIVYYTSFKVVPSLLRFLAFLVCVYDPSHVAHISSLFYAIYLTSQYLLNKWKRDCCQDMLRRMNNIGRHEISRISFIYLQMHVEKCRYSVQIIKISASYNLLLFCIGWYVIRCDWTIIRSHVINIYY
jgi:hypothetical protein